MLRRLLFRHDACHHHTSPILLPRRRVYRHVTTGMTILDIVTKNIGGRSITMVASVSHHASVASTRINIHLAILARLLLLFAAFGIASAGTLRSLASYRLTPGTVCYYRTCENSRSRGHHRLRRRQYHCQCEARTALSLLLSRAK